AALARWADVDDEGEERLHDGLAGGGVLRVGLGDIELELAAVGALLLVDVGDDGRALEDVADLGPALVLERLLAVEDGAAGAAQTVDREAGGAAGAERAPGRHHERERGRDRRRHYAVHLIG